MVDDIDRAQARHAELLADALRDQAHRAGLNDKVAADWARVCQARGCGEEIPQARRQALPGVQFCAACQARREKRKGAAQ